MSPQLSFCNFSNFRGKPLVLISSCLLGNNVRYDGQAKRNAALIQQLLPHLQPLVVCPEAMAGLGIPRPPVQLIMGAERLEARGRDDPSLDVTDRLIQMARIQDQAHYALAGAILQSRSPSCGTKSTPNFNQYGEVATVGPGLFTGTLLQARRWLPTLEDTDVDTPALRIRFLLKVSLCADWLHLTRQEPHAWQWTLDFFRHHDDTIRQLTLDDAEAMQPLFLGSVPHARQTDMRQTIDLFFVSKAGNYSR